MNLLFRLKKTHNDGLQLRRAISIQAEGKRYSRNMLSRRQLQRPLGGGATRNGTPTHRPEWNFALLPEGEQSLNTIFSLENELRRQ